MKRLFTRFLLLISSGALLWQVVILAWLLLQKGDPTTPITVQVRSGSYGVIDGNGVELVAADWFYLTPFGRNGRATGKKNATDTYCSVINAKGEVLGSFTADTCYPFGNNQAAQFSIGYRQGLINSIGQVILPANMYNVMEKTPVNTSLFTVERSGSIDYFTFRLSRISALYNSEGKKILSPEWNHIDVDRRSGLIFATKKQTSGQSSGTDAGVESAVFPYVFNGLGKLILEPKFPAGHISSTATGLIVTNEKGKSFITLDGEWVLRDYLDIRDENGLLLITSNEKMSRTGLADAKGNILVPTQYAYEFHPLRSGSNMLFIGQSLEDDLYYAFRTTGEKLEDSGWAFVTTYEPTSDRFAGAFNRPGRDEPAGFQVMNGMGEKIFECDYEHLEAWNPNGTVVATGKNGVKYLLDRMGKVVDESTKPFSPNPEHPANSYLKFEKMSEGKESDREAGWWDRLGRKIDIDALSDEELVWVFSRTENIPYEEMRDTLFHLYERTSKLRMVYENSAGFLVTIDGEYGFLNPSIQFVLAPVYSECSMVNGSEDMPLLIRTADRQGQSRIHDARGNVICEWGGYLNSWECLGNLLCFSNDWGTIVLWFDKNNKSFEVLRKIPERWNMKPVDESDSHLIVTHSGQEKWRQGAAEFLTKFFPSFRASLDVWSDEDKLTAEIWNSEGKKIWENTRMSNRDRLLWVILPLALAATFFYWRVRKYRPKHSGI